MSERTPVEQAYWNLAWAIVKCDHVFIQNGKCTRCEKEMG